MLTESYAGLAGQGDTDGSAGEESSIGRIVSVTGSQAIVLLDHDLTGREGKSHRPEMGTLLKVDTPEAIVLGLVTALSVPAPMQESQEPEVWIAELELVGELTRDENGAPKYFRRGLSQYPSLGDRVWKTSQAELATAYAWNSTAAIRVGTIRQDSSIPAMVRIDELLGKHFAVLGTTGTGKSCAAALILRAILKENPEAHVILLDPHNEYTASFGRIAEIVTPDNLELPYWFLTFEELVEVVVGDHKGREQEVEILSELIPMAKLIYARKGATPGRPIIQRRDDHEAFSVDTPVPYRLSDLLELIRERMGTLELKNHLAPYKRLKGRIEALMRDPRYAFMFGSMAVQDRMTEILGRLLRIPVNGKPISIIQLTGLPSEVVNVVVSVLCRMTFDFALWSEGKVPVTLVCEEAHRYIPNDSKLGFEPTRRSIARIAKEGRKYGASLCIISQRPSELDGTILSQCNTIFALRMSSELDQQIVSAAVSDAAASMLAFLPSLGSREAIAFGDGVPMPVRLRFDKLPEEAMPKGRTAKFSERWVKPFGDEQFLETVVARWRRAGTGSANATNEDNLTEKPAEPRDLEWDAESWQAVEETLPKGFVERRRNPQGLGAQGLYRPSAGNGRSLRESLLKKPLSEL